MSELRLIDLSKAYLARKSESVTAVRALSLFVRPGECVALLGPSGAGKSTVLRLVAGLETPTAGDIQVNGRSLLALSASQRNVGMSFQYPALLPQLTAFENIQLGPKLRRKPADVDHIVRLLGIEPFLTRKPETLSGGEQQRVALGRALANKPEVLLLDEPLANLDPIARQELRGLIRQVQRDLHLTILYVTHDQAEAAAVADRIAVLRDGSLQQIGTAEALYQSPVNLFVARFFGRDGLNTLRGRLARNGDSASFVGGSFRITVPASASKTNPEGHKLIAAFRPSAATPRKGGSGWRIQEKRALGWTTLLVLNDGICCETSLGGLFTEQETIGLEIENVLLFDAVSEQRIV